MRIASYEVRDTTSEKLRAEIAIALRKKNKLALFFANTNLIVKCRFLVDDARGIPRILVNDGIGMDIAALILYGKRFQENLNGTDFVPYLFRTAERPLKVFMIGGTNDVLKKAVNHVTEELQQVVVGTCNGYEQVQDTSKLIQHINKTVPDIILVAMGNPLQEKWIVSHGEAANATAFIGVGALFDFWACNKRRAPRFMRRLRLEWLYRLCLEPRRLVRRYTLDIVVFLQHCFRFR